MSSQAEPQPERRRIARHKSFLRGMVTFNNRRNDCLIRDISPYGARLIFTDAITTPDVLDLYIPQKDQTVRSHVIWRHGSEIGVAFPQAAQMEPAAEAGDLGERVARLEVEIAGLKRLLKKMKTDGAGQEFDVA